MGSQAFKLRRGHLSKMSSKAFKSHTILLRIFFGSKASVRRLAGRHLSPFSYNLINKILLAFGVDA